MASGSPLAAALSPLMAGADAGTFEQAAAQIWASGRERQERERFLTELAVFARGLVGPQEIEQILARVTMEHDIIEQLRGYQEILEKGALRTLRRMFERRLGRPLQEGESQALAGKVEMLGADAVGDVGLEVAEAERLRAWLLAP